MSSLTTKAFVCKKVLRFQKIYMCFIEKYIIVLDKLYRCFILYCLNRAVGKKKENKGRLRIAANILSVLIRSCQGGIT